MTSPKVSNLSFSKKKHSISNVIILDFLVVLFYDFCMLYNSFLENLVSSDGFKNQRLHNNSLKLSTLKCPIPFAFNKIYLKGLSTGKPNCNF